MTNQTSMTTYTFQPYDVLQIERDGRWLDFATLRSPEDAAYAIDLVDTGYWENETRSFRIRRGFDNIVCSKSDITIELPTTVLCALGLDDSVMQMERGLNCQRLNSRCYVVAGAMAQIALVLDDVLSRSSSTGGWDQPRSAQAACKRAFPKLVAQVQALGYTVRVNTLRSGRGLGLYGSVQISR